MIEIRHRVAIKVPSDRVYSALTAGLCDARGPLGTLPLGATAEFGLQGRCAGTKMRVIALDPGRRISWRCVEGPLEWIGTELEFALSLDEGGVVLEFRQIGFRAAGDFFAHCDYQWGVLLTRLKRALEEDWQSLTAGARGR
jgi:hypothetical protein